MKMRRGLTLLLIGIFMFQVISAIDTPIMVKTVTYESVYARITNPSGAYLDSFSKTSNMTGDVSYLFSTSSDTFKISIWVRQADNTVTVYKAFPDTYPSGTPLNLELFPDSYVQPVQNTTTPANSTENSTTQINATLNNGTQQQQTTTGTGFSFITNLFTNKNIIYGAGILAVLIIIFFFIFFMMKRNKQKKFHNEGFKKNDWNSFRKENKENFYQNQKTQEPRVEREQSEDELEAAQRKIREAQDTINRIKNQGKMRELKNKVNEDKRKMMQDEQELRRLSGEHPQNNNPDKNQNKQFNPNKNKQNPNSFRKEDRSNKF